MRVQEMLSYLATALPPRVCAQSRLLALQCALRTDAHGLVAIPAGLLRGIRISQSLAPWQQLEEENWVRPMPEPAMPAQSTGIVVQLLDHTVLTQAPTRRGRLRAADWALRTSSVQLDGLPSAARLVALALAAQPSDSDTHGAADAYLIARACGIQLEDLTSRLDELVTSGAMVSWLLDLATEDLHWTVPRASA
ncbi:hypothetical protein [Streptomyces sp. LN499]|uniref:hypothetical protein n=1 Tax=Streptomyces sp. LN499 TaxID=3112977 RepID=UPI0037247A45